MSTIQTLSDEAACEASAVEIVLYSAALQPHFRSLNLAWIERFFVVEDEDRRVLDYPYENIIAPGGQIFFARDKQTNEILGTCALIAHGGHAEGDVFELAKMAVDEKAQGRKIGQKLLEAAIEYARARGKKAVELESHSSLTAAIKLYEKLGFVKTPIPQDTKFQRVDIAMRLLLT